VAFITLTPRLAEVNYLDALAIARTIRDKQGRLRALMGLVSSLAALNQLQEAFIVARELPKLDRVDQSPRVAALAELMRYLEEPFKSKALQEALAVVAGVAEAKPDSRSPRAYALAHLAPYLPAPLLQKTLAVTWKWLDRDQEGQAPRWRRSP